VGIGTPMAINGAAAHAFAHVLYKGLLLMGAGAVLHVTGTSKMTELGGLPGASLRIVFVLYMIGALSTSAFPLFIGFVSKSMVIAAAEEEHLLWVVFFLYGASVGTFLHTGLRLPYFTWFGRPQREVAAEYKLPLGMYLAMTLAALLSIGIGVYPEILYQWLPYPVHYEPYTASHIVHSLELLAFTGLGFWLLLEVFRPRHAVYLDTDWFYRKAGPPLRRLVLDPLSGVFIESQKMVDRLSSFASDLITNPRNLLSLDQPLPLGVAISLVLLVAALTTLWVAGR
jgi:multicomponent Na+:H+ antiporter subunit D